MGMQTAASSSLRFRIKPFEFSADIIKFKVPINHSLFSICLGSPTFNLTLKG